MKILDIFSWLPEKELGLDKIEEIVISLQNGVTSKEDYFLDLDLPTDANENVVNASKELLDEGKRVCYLIKSNEIMQQTPLKHQMMKYRICNQTADSWTSNRRKIHILTPTKQKMQPSQRMISL